MSGEQFDDYYQTLSTLLRSSLDEVKESLSDEDYTAIRDHLDHGAYGVAWELLWDLLHAHPLPIPADLVECGRRMGIDAL